MSGQQKLEQVEKNINSGDAKAADGVLATITDKVDQHIFKDALQRHCSAKDGLPECTIVGDEIHFGGAHKMTLTDKDGKLGMRDDAPSTMSRVKEAWNNFTHLPQTLGAGIKAAGDTTAAGDAVNRANTSESEQNRRWDRLIKQAQDNQ